MRDNISQLDGFFFVHARYKNIFIVNKLRLKMAVGGILVFAVLLSITEGFIFDDQRTSTRTLTVDNGGIWGNWRPIKYCPEHTFAVGYKLKLSIRLCVVPFIKKF